MAEPAKPAPPKYEPPKELEQKAAVQKFMGRSKRTPFDQAEYFYSVNKTHIVFFVCSLLMLVSFVFMFVKDYDRTWKDYQTEFAHVELEKVAHDLRELEGRIQADQSSINRLDSDIEAFLARFRAPEEKGKALPVTLFDDKAYEKVARLKKAREEQNGGDVLVHVKVNEEKKKLELVEKEEIRGEHHRKGQMGFNFAKSDWMAVRFQYEEAKHHYEESLKKSDGRSRVHEEHLKAVQKQWDAVNKTVDDLKKAFDEVDSLNTFYEDFTAALESRPVPGIWDKKPLADLAKGRKQLTKDKDEKLARLEREKPGLVQKIRNAPLADFFDPTLKVKQVILTDIKDALNFTKIEKIDRCHTCHVGIGDPAYAVEVDLGAKEEADRYVFKDEFLKSLVAHARSTVDAKACKVCLDRPNELKEPLVKHGSWTHADTIRYTKTFMAHPRLDLYVLGSSKHPLNRFGCTICHEGDGRDTDFSRAVHMPNARLEVSTNQADGSVVFNSHPSPDARAWRERHGTPFGEERYNWNYRELWDFPMIPQQLLHSSCRRCHSREVELDGAPRYVEGMKLFERVGCYACHRTDSYQILTKDVANEKLEPNRKSRRPGPPLTRIATKVTEEWAMKWILAPREFRPTTRMPHFFAQSNSRHKVLLNSPDEKSIPPTGQGHERHSPIEDTVVASIVKYLWSISATDPDPAPPGNLKGDAKRGELLVKQVGCLACHKVEPTTPEQYREVNPPQSHYLKEFAPNLSGIGAKIKDPNWLYHWVRNPKMHFAESNMPNLRLSEQEAADVVVYLMTLKATTPAFEAKKARLEIDPKLLDDLVYEQLRLKMPDFDARLRLKEMQAQPDEKVRWLGQKMVVNYGCYSCHTLKPDKEPFDTGGTAIRWEDMEGIGVELTGSQPFGSKHYDRLDFGYAMDDGVNHKGVTFKHGFWETEIRASVHESRQNWFMAKLRNPRIFDGGKMDSKPQDEHLRMPNFGFSDDEIELLSNFVLSFTDHAEHHLVEGVKKGLSPAEEAANRGERIVRDSNCRACHRLSLDRYELEWTRVDPANRKKSSSFVWIEGRKKAEQPIARLQALGLASDPPTKRDERKKLRNYDWVTDARTLELPEVLKKTESIEVYYDGADWWFLDPAQGSVDLKTAEGSIKAHPLRRETEQDGGEVLPQIQAVKREQSRAAQQAREKIEDEIADLEGKEASATGVQKTEIKEKIKALEKQLGSLPAAIPDTEIELRYPPMLRTQGVKTQADWLFSFLKSPSTIRPALFPLRPGVQSLADVNIRMPTFDFTDEEASSIVRWFAVRDHLPGTDHYPHTAFPEREAAFLAGRTGALEKARKVIFDKEKGCASCHFANGEPPPGLPTKYAPDLAGIEQRLRPRWLYAWVKNPAGIYPGIIMPGGGALFPDAKTPEEVQDGINSSVEYFLNWHRLPREAKQ